MASAAHNEVIRCMVDSLAHKRRTIGSFLAPVAFGIRLHAANHGQ